MATKDPIPEINEFLNTISEEGKGAVLKKCEELKFNIERGVIGLTESYINLFQARDILADAIEKKKISQLPLSIQCRVRDALANIVKFQKELIAGADQVPNLASAIETLYTEIWNSRLDQLSGDLLGYQTKLNQVKNLEVQISKQTADLGKTIGLKGELESILNEAGKKKTELTELQTTSNTNATKINETLAATIKALQEAQAKLATIIQNEATAAQSLAKTQASQTETKRIEEGAQKFFQQIDGFRAKMTQTEEAAQKAVAQNKKDTEALLTNLNALTNRIKDQIDKATGFSLFDSFQKRKEGLASTKFYWAFAGLIFMLALMGLVFYITRNGASFHDNQFIFWLRLSITIPLGIAIYFCLEQYSRERRLEEEYNFRANISTSLVPYRDIVKDMTDKAEYSKFLIETINKVFSSPTDKVFGSLEQPTGAITEKNIKAMDSIFDTMKKWFTIGKQ